MANVDSLSIQISAEAQQAEKSIASLITSMNTLKRALAGASRMLDGSAYKKATSEMTQATKTMSDNLIKQFNITNREVQSKVKELTKAYAEAFKSNPDRTTQSMPQEAVKAVNELARTVARNKNAFDPLKTSAVDALEHIKKQKIYVSDMIVNDLGDNWDYLRKNLAQVFTLDKNNLPVDSLYGELSGMYKDLFPDDITNPTDQFEQIVKVIQQAHEEVRSNSEKTKEDMIADMHEVVDYMQQQSNTLQESFRNALNPDNIDAENLGKSLEKSPLFDSSNINKAAENMEKLSTAFNSIGNITINSLGISELASSLKTLGNVNFENITDGLKNFVSLAQTDFSNIKTLSDGITGLAVPITQLGNIKANVFTRIASDMDKLAKIDATGLNNSAGAISTLASAVGSVGDLTSASEQLSNFANSIGRLGMKSVTNATTNIAQLQTTLVNFIRQINSVGAVSFDTAGLANLIATIQRLGNKSNTQAVANLPIISAQIQNMIRQLNNIGTLSFDMTGLESLVTALSRLGSKTVTNAVTNIPRLAVALKQLMQTLSTAPMVSHNLIQMTNALANLASQGQRMGSASKSLVSGLDRFTASANRARKSTTSLAAAFGKFYATWFLVIRGIKKVGQMITTASDLVEVQNVVDTTFGNMSSRVEEFVQDSIQQFGMSELAVKQYSSRFQAMGTAMGISSQSIGKANDFLAEATDGYVQAGNSMADVSMNLTKLTADMASFYNVEQDVVAEKLAAVFTGQTRYSKEWAA